MTKLLIAMTFVIMCLTKISTADDCPNTGGSVSEALSLVKACKQQLSTVCSKVGAKPLPACFIDKGMACLKTNIEPCLLKKAKDIFDLIKLCAQDKGALTATGLCKKSIQDQVVACAEQQFEKNKSKYLMAIEQNIGLICNKGEAFRKCLHDAVLCVK